MPNDAKLGLVIGVVLVIAVATIFFRKEVAASKPGPDSLSALKATPAASPSSDPSPTSNQPVKAQNANRVDAGLTAKNHTVTEGETLFSLAQRYYGNEDRYVDLYRVNRELVKAPDQLIPGTVLIIPELEEKTESAHVSESNPR